VILVTDSIMGWITFIDFCMLNHPCIAGRKLPWSWCMILNMFLNLVCKIFLENFCSHQGNCSVGLCFCHVPFWWNGLWRIGVSCSLKSDRIQQRIHLLFTLLENSLLLFLSYWLVHICLSCSYPFSSILVGTMCLEIIARFFNILEYNF
jgi:hypothetical protein